MTSPSGPVDGRTAPTPATILEAARAAQADHRYDVAFELSRILLARGENIGDLWGEAALLANDLGDAVGAVEAQKRYAAARPDDPAPQANLANYLARAARMEEALDITARLLARDPQSPRLNAQHAVMLLYSGDMDGARDAYQRTLKLNPQDIESWRQLVKLDGFESPDKAAAEMEALSSQWFDAGRTEQASALQFALGDLHEKTGALDRAAAHFDRAQEPMEAIRPHSVEGEGDFIERTKSIFDGDFYERVSTAGERQQSNRPVFIVSLPRSGSTLVERMLNRHSGVAGGGELEALRLACYPLGQFAPEDFKRFARAYGDNAFNTLGGRYLQFVSEIYGAQGRVVDKSLEIPLLAGPALAGLPEASFVWLSRDPRDTALSIYKTPFPRRADWTWSWERIAHRIVHAEALKRHFMALFPERILDLQYEALVSDPDTAAPRLLDHCGLPPEPVQTDFYKGPQVVNTASLMQVRQPITTSNIGQWRRWDGFLQPFTDIFERIWPEEWGEPYHS